LNASATPSICFADEHNIFRLGDELEFRKPANLFAVHAW
jgi:hypothetical protein